MATEITDQNTILERDHRYLLYFDLGPIPADILRKISDWTNISTGYLNYAGKLADVELLGTTVAQGSGPGGGNQLLALVRVTGTPLLAAVAPIVAVVIIVAGFTLFIVFRKALDVTLQATAKTIEDVGQGVKDLADGAAKGIESTGTGLEIALPVLALGVAVIVVGIAVARYT